MDAKEFFKLDRFATEAGIELIDIKPGYGKAQMIVEPRHLNAGNTTQGGAIFTLADLALAAAANSHGTLALSTTSNITFLRGSGPGDTLFAEAKERYMGRKTGHYQVDVTNQNNELIATFEATVYRKDQALSIEL
ncbi:PaaI family thioesterase [Bacteroides sp. 519]|uniref:PaaI family thioesterase n=1 Tax=Bacteroides sp. 519 TaxID=2302937 RepID=UPI0013D63468|nr:hotdog fold thioesterase [Bacteroides sp. 519]NDV57416.1 hotdog fold thioesterase [Bacteroides sp. 519]